MVRVFTDQLQHLQRPDISYDAKTHKGMDLAKMRVEAAFEMFEILDAPFFAFHDRDIAPEGSTLKETNQNLDMIVGMIKDYMRNSGVKLLWNTANMFTNPVSSMVPRLLAMQMCLRMLQHK